MTNYGIQASGPNPYHLPAGKEYHIFIACSGLDSGKGKWLLEQLEGRYPLRCVYHERDFHPGAMIVDNMREYIDKSVKVLLLISNGFLQSYHCKLEETFAMSLSNESGKNCIIPVLLEDVELPPVLRHMTYIDATIDGDIVAQIREAYCKTGILIHDNNMNSITLSVRPFKSKGRGSLFPPGQIFLSRETKTYFLHSSQVQPQLSFQDCYTRLLCFSFSFFFFITFFMPGYLSY